MVHVGLPVHEPFCTDTPVKSTFTVMGDLGHRAVTLALRPGLLQRPPLLVPQRDQGGMPIGHRLQLFDGRRRFIDPIECQQGPRSGGEHAWFQLPWGTWRNHGKRSFAHRARLGGTATFACGIRGKQKSLGGDAGRLTVASLYDKVEQHRFHGFGMGGR